MSRVIVVAGATGLVGRECLRLAARDPGIAQVIALVRRFVHPSAQPNKVEYRIVPFDRLEDVSLPAPIHSVVCALGTTMRQAGSPHAFRLVDHDYVLALARRGLAWGATHFLLVSSLGADPGSRAFYTRVKGEVERAVAELPYRSLTIVRPSFLVGERAQRRTGELLAQRLGGLLPPRYRPVPAERVAAALLAAIAADQPGARILENRALRDTPIA